MKLLRLMHAKPIFVQLVAFSLLISIIPLMIISSYLFHELTSMVKDELTDYHIQITSQYFRNVEEKLGQYQNSLSYISNNTVIQNALTDETMNPYDRGIIISEEVSKSLQLESSSEIRNCMVYSMMTQNPVYGKSVSMMEEAGREGWYPKEKELEEGWFCYFTVKNQYQVLSIVKNIIVLDVDNLSRMQIGVVKLDILMEKLLNPVVWNMQKNAAYDVIVYEQEGAVLYTTVDNGAGVLEEWLNIEKTAADNMRQEIGSYVVWGKNLEDYGIGLLLLFDIQEMSDRMSEMMVLILPMIFVMVLAVIGCVYIYTKDFSSRIAVLVNKFQDAQTGDLTVKDPIEGNDEIAQLDRHFGSMLEKLDRLIRKNYIQELENKEYRLRNLQLQINPHFLYNTLETISSIAAVKQAFVVCDMCRRLGDMFRYSLGRDEGEFVMLERELDHIKNYIFIQEIRYGNRMQVFYDVEGNVQECLVPRFILQPIVENAIIHGLGRLASMGTLEICGWQKEGTLYLRIEDDGIGMDEDKLERLRLSINGGKGEETGIGIQNVNQRIKLICGEQYGIDIESRQGLGSRFTLRLPYATGGKRKNET